jgi:hypothetical protein
VNKQDLVEVMNMLYRGGKMYFGPDSLSHLDFTRPVFELADKTFQYLFFKDRFWKVTATGIQDLPLSELTNYVWKDKINDFQAKLLPEPMVKIEKIDEDFFNRVGSE